MAAAGLEASWVPSMPVCPWSHFVAPWPLALEGSLVKEDLYEDPGLRLPMRAGSRELGVIQ